MTDVERAVRMVNEWIEGWRIHLKDGSPHGVHPKAKEALIQAVADAIGAAKRAMPPEVKPSQPSHHGRERARPKRTALPAKPAVKA